MIRTYHLPVAGTTRLSSVYQDSYAQRVLADKPSNYWRLNEPSGTVATDLVGGANGTIAGGVTLAQPGALADGDTAMTFNGTTGKVVTAASVALPVVWTCEAWVQPTVDSSQRPYVQIQGSGDAFYFKRYGDGIGALGVQVNFGSGGQSNLFSDIALSTGLWHHVVVVLVSGLVPEMYIDGVKRTVSGSLAKSLVGTAAASVELGSASAWPQFWLGSLDEVAIYPVALTPAQIAAHYATGLTSGPPAVDLAAADIPYRQLILGPDPANATALLIGDASVGVGGEGLVLAPGAERLAFGPFDDGPLKLSQFYASGQGAVNILGVPF